MGTGPRGDAAQHTRACSRHSLINPPMSLSETLGKSRDPCGPEFSHQLSADDNDLQAGGSPGDPTRTGTRRDALAASSLCHIHGAAADAQRFSGPHSAIVAPIRPHCCHRRLPQECVPDPARDTGGVLRAGCGHWNSQSGRQLADEVVRACVSPCWLSPHGKRQNDPPPMPTPIVPQTCRLLPALPELATGELWASV